MIFEAGAIPGTFLVRPEPLDDERGLFARVWCRGEFAAKGLAAELGQCSLSFNPKRGTLRGLHYQASPLEEAKLVRCTRGAIFDVAVDLRPDSRTFRHWISAELTEENRAALYVPPGCAHGFMSLRDDTEVLYMISREHSPEHARGVRWDDPAFGITWPRKWAVLSARDAGYPDFKG